MEVAKGGRNIRERERGREKEREKEKKKTFVEPQDGSR